VELDQKPLLLTVDNGTVDLRTGKLRPSTREDLLTQKSPLTYDPAARCPAFETFMQEIMCGREDLVAFLQRYFGYCITGITNEQVFAIFYGLGANGKSTLLEVIRKVLGREFARQTPPHTLMAVKNSGGGPSPEIARLRGSRLVMAVETEQGTRLAEGIIKSQTGAT
jgi:putative DNA primase/helicase